MTMKRLLQTQPSKLLLDAPEPESLGAPEKQSEQTKHIISCH